jgi:hypothetical protein
LSDASVTLVRVIASSALSSSTPPSAQLGSRATEILVRIAPADAWNRVGDVGYGLFLPAPLGPAVGVAALYR